MPKYKYAVLDIESEGLDRYKHNINYIGIGLAEEIGQPLSKTYILNMYKGRDKPRLDKIVALLKRDKVKLIWQNGKFDTLFMDHHYGVMLPIHYDVMLMGTAYELAVKHGLDAMAERYLGVPTWDIPLKEKIKPNNPVVEKYLEKDLKYPWELFCYFVDHMEDLHWKHFNELLKPAFLMYRRTEKKGIYYNVEGSKSVRKTYKKLEQEKLAQLNKHADINWNSPKQVQQALFGVNGAGLPTIKISPKTGQPSADAKVLKRLAAKGHDLPKLLLEYKENYGALTKFLNKWPAFAAHDGRIHPSFNITNVLTGRTSCSNPNLQQVPRRKDLRGLYTAAKGRKLIEVDYSQIELRVAADYSQDRTMLKIYRTGGDIHTRTACDITGKKPQDITKQDRTGAKGVNFGYLYGMLAKKYVDYAFDTYGIVVTRQEAERTRQIFFNTYSGLFGWHEEMKDLTAAMGGATNRFGRFRALPEIYSGDRWERMGAERQGINTPVQSTASDLLLFSAIQCDLELRRAMDVWVVGTIHDAILFDVPEDVVDDAANEIKRIMVAPKALEVFDVSFSVPIEVDVSIGAWGQG